MKTMELKKELKAIFPKIRQVAKGQGSLRGMIQICAALYDDPQRWELRNQMRSYIKEKYPNLLVHVY